jgi:hypothetical protein
MLDRTNRRPSQLDAVAFKHILESAKLSSLITNFPRQDATVDTATCEKTDRFANVPLDGMQSVTSVGNVGDSQIFASWQQVVHSDRNQAAQWNLERQGRDIYIMTVTSTRMEVDAVTTDTNGIMELFGFPVRTARCAHMLFQNGKLCLDPARLSYVRIHSQPVICTDDIWTQAKTRVTLPAIRPRRFCLQPIEQG